MAKKLPGTDFYKRMNSKYWRDVQPRLISVRLMVEDGATNKQVAAALGVSLTTVLNWRSYYPEFNECFTLGRQKMCDKMQGVLYQKAMGIVDSDVTTTVTKDVYDNDLGCYVPETTRTRVKKTGTDMSQASETAAIALLKAYQPEVFNSQPEDTNIVDAVNIVEDIPQLGVEDSTETKLLYDDSQDVNNDEQC